MRDAGRALLDLIFPPQALDDGPRPLAAGLSADPLSHHDVERTARTAVARLGEVIGRVIAG